MYIANTFRVNPIINPCTRLDYKLFLLALYILYLKNVLNKWEIMWWVAATTSFIAIKYNTYKALIRKTYIVVWNSCVATRSQDHDNILKHYCQEFIIAFAYLLTKCFEIIPIVFKSLNIKVIQATSSENILQTLHNFKSALLLTLSCMQISLM